MNSSRLQLIYICSPVRSGSTFLQAMLSTHPRLVGLGEVNRVLKLANESSGSDFFNQSICTCGETGTNCRFWSHLEVIKRERIITQNDILEVFNSVYPSVALVDSSKNLEFVKNYQENSDIELKVLNLVRDFRGWALSVTKYQMKSRPRKRGKFLMILTNCYRWLYTTKKRIRFLENNNLQYLNISYENLVFSTEEQLDRIYDFLETENSSNESGSYHLKNSHELLGNKNMKSSENHSRSIFYDVTWFTDLRIPLMGILVFPVTLYSSHFMKKNR